MTKLKRLIHLYDNCKEPATRRFLQAKIERHFTCVFAKKSGKYWEVF